MWPIKSEEQKAKLYVSFIIFIVSVYLSVTVHEYGHALFYYFYGCQKPLVLINPLVINSYTDCLSPQSEEFFQNLTVQQTILSDLGGIIVQSIFGVIFLYLFFNIEFVKKNYVLSLFSFFFSLTNFGHMSMYLAFNPFGKTGDIIDIIRISGVNGFIVSLSGILLIIFFLFYYRLKFPMLLDRIEPGLNKKHLRKTTKLFLLALIVLIIFFGVFMIID